MENSTTSMEYCTIFLQNNIPQNSHALSISVVHIMQHLSQSAKSNKRELSTGSSDI